MARLSLSALANEIGGPNDVDRSAIEKFLAEQGFIVDIRTPTEYGLNNGISIKQGENGGSWPVYDESIQDLVRKNIPNLPKTLKPKKYVEMVKPQAKKNILHTRYPYLGLPDEFVVIDTETTGVKDTDEVVELSVVSSHGEVLYHSYYYPDVEVNPFAAKVNHLSKEKLAGNPKFSAEEAQKIVSAINGLPIVGHNISFDARMIVQTAEHYKLGGITAVIVSLATNIYDTMSIAKKHMKADSYALNNLTTMVGITREETHDSTGDCLMTLEFIDRLEDVLKIRNEYGFIKGKGRVAPAQENGSMDEIERD